MKVGLITNEYRMTRTPVRSLLIALVVAALALGAGSAAAQTLRVAVYGGYFQDMFDAHVFPRFTEETGIEVESIAAPTGMAWLVQLETAARANQAPADVSMMSQGPLFRGMESGLWVALDESRLENLRYVRPALVNRNAAGELNGVGAVSWYVTLVTNTDTYPEAPSSWA